MSITAEIQSLSPSATVELFVLDTTNIQGGSVSYFHAGTNKLQAPVIWQGQHYIPLPTEADGFSTSAKGVLPRPRFRVANINGMFSAEVRSMDDLIGSSITRKRTLVRYLDAVNFPGGVNPTADPNQFLTDDVWYVDRKVSENRYVIEFELSSAFDLQGVMLPYREVIQNSCTWDYRGPECGYTDAVYFNANDVSCDLLHDVCPKRLSSCKVRHPGAVLPYGAFPGSVKYE